MNKDEIAQVFLEMAELLELRGENHFKIRAYRAAARELENLETDLGTLVREKRLREIPGVGAALAEKIETLYTQGTLPIHEEMKKETPLALLELLHIPGLGIKKIFLLYEKLQIQTLAELQAACEKGLVRTLQGFGPKTEKNILESISHYKKNGTKMLWWEAQDIVHKLLKALKNHKEVEEAEIGGSFRRGLETIDELQFVVATKAPNEVMNWFSSHSIVHHVIEERASKLIVMLKGGLQAEIRFVSKKEFPFALHYATGSKEHVIHMRDRARSYGLSLNERGFESIIVKKIEPLEISKERDIYKTLGLEYITPELREDRGEIKAAETNALPKPLLDSDIRGVFHNHTTESDGKNTLEEMVKATELLGWEYIGISDHSKSSAQANGLDENRLMKQIEAIRKLNVEKRYKIHVFSGSECDILSDGSLDYPDELLKELDYVIVSIHRGFKQDEETMTKRLIRAIEHPLSTMVGHLTGRLLLRREPYLVHVDKVIDCAIANQKIIEINANPERLDMDWRFWHKAKDKGLMTSINCDAHYKSNFAFIRAGINVARKGWLEKENVLNTFPLHRVMAYLKRSR